MRPDGLAYRLHGSGPPIVLIHGDFTNGDLAWAGQVGELSNDFQLVALDRRGFGASPREPRPYTIASDAADVLELVAALGLPRFHLIGHSYGGLVALEVARTASMPIASLHLIEPPYMALLPDHPDVRRLVDAVRSIFQMDRSLGPEQFALAFVSALAGLEAAARTRTRRFWPAIVADAMRGLDAEWPGDYPAAVAAEITIAGPISVHRGGLSHPGLRAIAGELARILPSARLIDIDEAGHDVQRSAAPFNAAFRATIDELTTG